MIEIDIDRVQPCSLVGRPSTNNVPEASNNVCVEKNQLYDTDELVRSLEVGVRLELELDVREDGSRA
jgi:hypothetical protein